MGRKRRKDQHLPPRVYERRGKFYFDSPVTGKWEPLGDDLPMALKAYGAMIAPTWRGRVLRDTITRYKTEITAKKTGRAYRAECVVLDRFAAVFGDMVQDDLTQLHLYQYVDRRRDTRKQFRNLNRPALTAAKHDIALLRLVMQKGIRWGAGTANAAFGIEIEIDRAPTREVPHADIEAVRSIATDRMQLAIDLALLIGQRRGDLLTLRFDEITEEGIPDFQQSKTGAPLFIEMTPALEALFKRARAMSPQIPREFVLRTRSGQPYTPDGFGANWQRLMGKAVKLELITQRFKFKDIRARAAQDKAGKEGLQAAQELMGHTTPTTTRKHYVPRVPAKRVRPVR